MARSNGGNGKGRTEPKGSALFEVLKGIDFEKADLKGLKTLALCWAYMKRAFSVSGGFRRMLSELIAELRAVKGPRQVNLLGEVLSEEKFSVLGFVPAYVVQLLEDVWFRKLDRKQIVSVDEYLAMPYRS